MNLFQVTSLALLLFGFSTAQFSINGECPEKCVSKMNNFKFEQMEGIWFKQAGTFLRFQSKFGCAFLNYSKSGDDSGMIRLTEIHEETDKIRVITGTIESNPAGVFNITYDRTQMGINLPFQLLTVTRELYVAIVCFECGFYSKGGAGLYGYIVTRVQFPVKRIVESGVKMLTDCGIPRSFIEYFDQTNCTIC